MTAARRVTADDLKEAKGLTDFQKLWIVIQGEPSMGIEGIRGRVEKNAKWVKWLLVLNCVTLAVVLDHLGGGNEIGSILGAIVKFFGGL